MKNNQIKIKELIKKYNGYLIVEIFNKTIPYHCIKFFIKNNKDVLEKIQRGLYKEKSAWKDIFFEKSIMNKNIIFSHQTSLWIHGLMEKEPLKIEITIPQGYNNKIINSEEIKIKYIKQELFNLGQTHKKTIYGNTIKVYDLERTICDVIKQKDKIDSEIYNKAWNYYLQHPQKNLNNLFLYAQQLNVWKIVEKYMEVSIVNY